MLQMSIVSVGDMRGALDLAVVSQSHRKLLCTLWCLIDSKTSLCCLLSRLSSLSVRLLIIQRHPELRSSAAAALRNKKKKKKMAIVLLL